jgi:glycosyltransferase involved in cell wall biosynthesis
MTKRTIAMIADLPASRVLVNGGVQAVSASLAHGLVESQCIELHVITITPKAEEITSVERDGMLHHLFPQHSFSSLTGYARSREDLRTLLRDIKPDLVHGQGAGADGYLAVRSDTASVVTFHGMMREDARFVSSLRGRLRLTLQSAITERYCVHNAPNAILISPYVRDYFGNSLRGRVRSIPNPVAKEFFDLERRVAGRRILYAGRVIPRKGVHDLIRAIGRLRNSGKVSLVIAGSLSDTAYVSRVRQLVRDMNLEGCVEFPGLLGQDQLLSEFSSASVLVLPSYQETAPMVVQQAMAARLPVVATDICGLPDQLDHGRCGLLFQPGDIAALTRHLESLLSEGGTSDALATRAYHKAQSTYDEARVTAATIEFYEEILRS